MKKLLIATAIAASMATGAHAATTYAITSNITGLGLFAFGNTNLLTSEPGGYYSGIVLGGTAVDVDDNGSIDTSAVTLAGEVGFVAAGLPIRLTFGLNSGAYTVGSGVTFSGGTVNVEAYVESYTDEENGYVDYTGYIPYSLINAAETPLPFLAGQPGHWVDLYPSQTSAGLLLAPGVNVLPGLWDGVPESAGFNNAVASLVLLGTASGMFLDGTVTLTEVPVPGAAWLFGSAMLGLAGASRKRKAA